MEEGDEEAGPHVRGGTYGRKVKVDKEEERKEGGRERGGRKEEEEEEEEQEEEVEEEESSTEGEGERARQS